MHFQKILALAAMISFTYAMPRAIMARSPIESLTMDPAGHFEVRSDGTILSWDGLNNVIDSVKLSSVEFDELTARNPHLLRGDLQSVESPANNGMTPRGKPEDLSNGILSLKKELQSNAILGTIPLLWYEQGLDVQSAVESTCEFLKTAVSISDEAVARILREYQDDASEYDALVAYIDVLRTNIKRNYYWSVRTRQYLIPSTLQKDESMAIVL
ncbi:hypothetical protein BKA61DRAFT_737381 [Leptodontidium sp. MPI-SDFR-AT-0119]|nr:hypothetical protein BKA61DRAFT_737381 [Leptodontidium sp. MPI-SDFR-AT-0119]